MLPGSNWPLHARSSRGPPQSVSCDSICRYARSTSPNASQGRRRGPIVAGRVAVSCRSTSCRTGWLQQGLRRRVHLPAAGLCAQQVRGVEEDTLRLLHRNRDSTVSGDMTSVVKGICDARFFFTRGIESGLRRSFEHALCRRSTGWRSMHRSNMFRPESEPFEAWRSARVRDFGPLFGMGARWRGFLSVPCR